ncbi:MAG: acylphosphatase [Xenococcaceae cyanobacterium]
MQNSGTSQNFIGVRVVVSGTVQGVGYRYYTARQAEQLGVKGWVKNLANGDVEAVFTGDRFVVERMVKWCHRGPSAAVVTNVAIEPCESGEFNSFQIRR